MSIVSRQGLLKVMVLSLVIVFGLGVLPCTAQADTTYSLAKLIAEGEEGKISVGTLEFFNFGFTSSGIGTPQADSAGIFLEAVGIDTPQPGLRVLANNQLSVSGAMTVFQVSNLTYDVRDTNESIQGRSLLLVPRSAASGSHQITVHEDITGSDRITASRTVPPNSAQPDELLAEADFSDPQEFLSITTIILIQASPNGLFELGQVGLRAFEQRFKLADTRADAGPDQVVQDTVMLDGTDSEGNIVSYKWELIPRYGTSRVITVESENATVTAEGLENNIYDVTLTVTDEGDLIDQDTAIVAAAGPCEPDSNKLPVNDKLHLWRFKIKKYKHCNWAFARVYGTLDTSEFPLDSSNDEEKLTAKVILQLIDQNKKIVGEYSDEIPAEIKDHRYKYVIRNKWW